MMPSVFDDVTEDEARQVRAVIAEKQREAHQAIRDQISALSRQADELPLPDYFEHPTCCEGQGLQVVTDGMSQWCDVDEIAPPGASTTAGVVVEGPYMLASTDGWDDMSEDGNVHYLQCRECYTVWQMPEDLVWN